MLLYSKITFVSRISLILNRLCTKTITFIAISLSFTEQEVRTEQFPNMSTSNAGRFLEKVELGGRDFQKFSIDGKIYCIPIDEVRDRLTHPVPSSSPCQSLPSPIVELTRPWTGGRGATNHPAWDLETGHGRRSFIPSTSRNRKDDTSIGLWLRHMRLGDRNGRNASWLSCR